jgi:V/A-type H+-transporting ATPase subunit I
MSWREQMVSAPMVRAAVVAPERRCLPVLEAVADAGLFEPDPLVNGSDRQSGETSVDQQSTNALRTDACAVLPGWIPQHDVELLRARVEPLGGAVAELPMPRGVTPPTAHVDTRVGEPFRPLVTTYATVPYRDLDPTLFAALAYVVMFGMMFGDVAHGLFVIALGLAIRASHSDRLSKAKAAVPFLIGAGIAAVCFGFLYGEAFGPTGLVPTLWVRPLDDPETLLVAGLVLGTALLAITFVLATVNRWRESGPSLALYDASGAGGALLFAGAAAYLGSVVASTTWLRPLAVVLLAVGAILTFTGLLANAGAGASGVMQAVVEMFDTVLRLGSNVVSFTRLAAFGLTHAVITEVVWDGSVGLWERSGAISIFAAVVLFVVGNAAAMALSGLVGAIQALRLEYYELFSRLFITMGRPFTPWHISTQRSEDQ